MHHPFPPFLNSNRLILRRLQHDDASVICAYRSLPEVALYQSWEFFGPDDAEKLIDDQADREPGVPGTWFQLAIIEKSSGRLIGDCGLHCLEQFPTQIEFGITLAPDAQGRGYATETIGRLLQFAFEELEAHRVTAITDVLNEPAAALFRRVGFRQEGHFVDHVLFKGRLSSEFLFAMLRREWN